MLKFINCNKQNLNFRPYRRILINENKWRAARYGIEGKLIDFGKQEEVPTHQLIHELLSFIDDVVDELGSRVECEYVLKILEWALALTSPTSCFSRDQ